MSFSFHGKRALVTGAGQGIGRAIAIGLAKKGSKVVAISRTQIHLESLKQEVPEIETVCLDISNWKETEKIISNLGYFHLLVNNAGVASLQSVGDITEEEFDRLFSVNVKAVVNISQPDVLDYLKTSKIWKILKSRIAAFKTILDLIIANGMKKKGKGGSVVNISSQASLVALEKHATYCASKGALDQLTKVMALELGPFQIRVNCVNPTVVLTEMGQKAWGDPAVSAPMKAKIPLGKFCEIEDVVKAVLFLLSDDSSMITGAQVPIDGGYTIQ